MSSRFILPLLAAALAFGPGLACRKTAEPAVLRGDRLLLAPDREVLDQRLALVEAGRYAEARELWAARALLPPLTSPLDSGEMAWNRQMRAALDALAESGARPHALDRLARAFDRAHWYREARAVLERERGLAVLGPESERLLRAVTATARFAAAADSAVRASAEGANAVARLLDRSGLTSEALRARGLYLGLRFSPASDPDKVELAVIAGHEGPFTIRQGESEVSARRIVLDDDILSPPGSGAAAAASPWGAGSVTLIEDGVLLAYHHRSDLRRAATLLFLELERRGGRPPDAPAPLDSLASPGAAGHAALALRLRGAAPLFDRARATAPRAREEILRLFIRDFMAARMAQVEAGEARHLIDQREHPERAGEVEGAASRLLAALRYGPLPALRLADAVDAAAVGAGVTDDDEAEAARAILGHLARLAGGADLDGPDDARLRALAAEVEAERFPTP